MEEWVWEGSFDDEWNVQNIYDNSEFGYDGYEILELMDVESVIRSKFKIESYDLVSNILEIEEGFSVTIDLFTTYVEDGTQVPFTIFGKDIDLDDFEGIDSLEGNFQVFDNKSSISFNIKSDNIEEKYEFFTLLLTNNKSSVTIKIKGEDIPHSADPTLQEQYNLKFDIEHPFDSGILSIKLETKSVPDGTSVPFTIFVLGDYSNREEFFNSNLNSSGDGNFKGNFIVNDNHSIFDLNIRKDYFTEGVESYLLVLDNNQSSLPIHIQDTSQFFPNYTSYSYSIEFLSGKLPEGITLNSQIVEIDNETYLEFKFEGNAGNIKDYDDHEGFELPDNFSYDKFDTPDTFYQYGSLPELAGGNYTFLINQVTNYVIDFNIKVKIYSLSFDDNKPVDVREDNKNFKLTIMRNYSSTRNQFLKEYLEERRGVDGEAYFHHKGIDYDNFEDYMKILVEDLGFSFYV